ncbi:hypothetical protein JX266_006477 [Neoarthrinium moseri]|nr:hypothetical protein JX266_006477 [Neoarthrinium moseri]
MEAQVNFDSSGVLVFVGHSAQANYDTVTYPMLVHLNQSTRGLGIEVMVEWKVVTGHQDVEAQDDGCYTLEAFINALRQFAHGCDKIDPTTIWYKFWVSTVSHTELHGDRGLLSGLLKTLYRDQEHLGYRVRPKVWDLQVARQIAVLEQDITDDHNTLTCFGLDEKVMERQKASIKSLHALLAEVDENETLRQQLLTLSSRIRHFEELNQALDDDFAKLPSASERIHSLIFGERHQRYVREVRCDLCGEDMKGCRYHCGVCGDGDYSICEDCNDGGRHCLNESHILVRQVYEPPRPVYKKTKQHHHSTELPANANDDHHNDDGSSGDSDETMDL